MRVVTQVHSFGRTFPTAKHAGGCCLIILWLTACLARGAELPGGVVAELLEVEGVVEVARADQDTWIGVVKLDVTNRFLRPGDRVRTAERSRASLRLLDQSVVRLSERSRCQMEAPPEAEETVLVRLFRGVVYLLHRGAPGSVRFRSRSSSAATRGTEFNVAVDEETGRMILSLFEGEAELSNAQGSVVVRSGEVGTAEPGTVPAVRPMLEMMGVIEWCLYYPGVLDVSELERGSDWVPPQKSVEAYRAGDLLQALASHTRERSGERSPVLQGGPDAMAERIYQAALLLAVGRVDETRSLLERLTVGEREDPYSLRLMRLRGALLQVIATVQGKPLQSGVPVLASEYLAASYASQARGELTLALEQARSATRISAGFGYAWARLAELQFGFGHVGQAGRSVERSLALSPRNARALALKGFILAARDRVDEAGKSFDRAIALDGAFGQAWLGRGLVRIRRGDAAGGRRDLEVAAALEPQRSLFRSYLGKAFARERDFRRASKELELAREKDSRDPTPWLYSALIRQQRNRINQAVRDLEESKALNDERRIYRSRFLLDQDQAVRGANLAAIYRDAGFIDVSVREAGRALNQDYGNASSHLFLANSYNELRDPRLVNLRFETPWLTEYLLANLLAPVGANTLSQLVSEQEYSRLFQRQGLGFASVSEYQSRGDWFQGGSQYGTYGGFAYALEGGYRKLNGQRINNDLEQTSLSLQMKQQINLSDTLFLQTFFLDAEGGDQVPVFDPHDPNMVDPDVRFEERQDPGLLVGFHRQWGPGSHTLLLAGRLRDRLNVTRLDTDVVTLLRTTGPLTDAGLQEFEQEYRSHVELYTAEAQQIWQSHVNTVIGGLRYQRGVLEVNSRLDPSPDAFLFPFLAPISSSEETDFERFSLYAYEHWRPVESLRFELGVSYDRVSFPVNLRFAPLTDEEATRDQVSPKAGFVWSPMRSASLRGAYSRSLGGLSFDQSVRIEPSQVAGFNQAFRSLIPEGVAGSGTVPQWDVWAWEWEQRFPTATYFSVGGELLQSVTEQMVGAVELVFPPATATRLEERLDYEEKALTVSARQLVGENWSVGASYRVSQGRLETQYPSLPAGLTLPRRTQLESTLHHVNLFLNCNHRSGVFGSLQGNFYSQSNRGYVPDRPGDEFWQFDLYAGYRFPWRRAEVRLGLLNLTDQEYRLNPLNPTAELPRNRTLAVSVRFNL